MSGEGSSRLPLTVVNPFFTFPSELLKALQAHNIIRVIRPPVPNLSSKELRAWIKQNVAKADAMIVWIAAGPVDEDMLRSASDSLKVLSMFGVGYDHIDVPYCKSRNIKIGTSVRVTDDAVANETILILLMVLRRSAESMRVAREGGQLSLIQGTASDPHYLNGTSIRNKTVAFYGFGRIAQKVAERLLSMGPHRVLYKTSRSEAPFTASEYPTLHALTSTIYNGCTFEHRNTIRELVEEADVVICITSLTEDTRASINKETLSYFKQGAVLVNVGRGQVVVTDDLIESLRQGKLSGAGLDVISEEPNLSSDHAIFSPDLADRVVLFPHVASAEVDSRTAQSEFVVRNIVSGLGLTKDALQGIQDEQERKRIEGLMEGDTHLF
jgi:glyoxylate/hydroxypyruvate reductase